MSSSVSSDSQPVLKNFVPYKPKKGEEYMNEKQRDHFKEILLAWRQQLMQEVDRTVHHTVSYTHLTLPTNREV